MNRNASNPSSINSRGVHAKVSIPAMRPPVSGKSTSPERRRGGAQKPTEGNGSGSTPKLRHISPDSPVNMLLGLSKCNRSSPFTLNTSTRRLEAASPTRSWRAVSMRRKNRA